MFKAEVSCNVRKFKWMLKCFAGGKGVGDEKFSSSPIRLTEK